SIGTGDRSPGSQGAAQISDGVGMGQLTAQGTGQHQGSGNQGLFHCSYLQSELSGVGEGKPAAILHFGSVAVQDAVLRIVLLGGQVVDVIELELVVRVVGQLGTEAVAAGLLVATAGHGAVAVQTVGDGSVEAQVPTHGNRGPLGTEAQGGLTGVAGDATALGIAAVVTQVHVAFVLGHLVQMAEGDLGGQRRGGPQAVRTEALDTVEQEVIGITTGDAVHTTGSGTVERSVLATDQFGAHT